MGRLGPLALLAPVAKWPACVNPGSPMPPFRPLGERRLRRLAIFLEASRGIQ